MMVLVVQATRTATLLAGRHLSRQMPTTRSAWKGPFFQMTLLNAIKKDVKREGIQTRARNNTIIPAFVGARLLVHNGKEFMPLVIREEMVGYKLGDFVRCTKPFSYRATNANKKK